ncbi:MAG: hypothetical protein H7144_15865 [Burkholderiales bacterium]|nr:hypothetical protein [Phycisphaerae bacterium]
MSESTTITRVTPQDFEEQLRTLDRIATLVARGRHRETWRFEYAGQPYYVHFYPRTSAYSASLAAREFASLKTLQDFKIPAVRVNALLSGFQFGQRKGDAVITQGVERGATPGAAPDANPVVRLDQLNRNDRRAHHHAVLQIIAILKQMAAHDVGHASLSPASFLIRDGDMILHDVLDLKTEGLSDEHLMQFAHAAESRATRADRLRVWRALMDDKPIPRDRARNARYKKDLRTDPIQSIGIDDWRATFRARPVEPLAYSQASRLSIEASDWQREWPRLVARINADQLEVLKRDRSGDVLAGEITLQGRPIDVIVKRPRNKFWYRYLLDFFRASRARRLWNKTRWLQVRHIPTEYPLAVMEKRRWGYVVDAVALFERVPGSALDRADLNEMPPGDREDFFRACGRILRKIEDTGLTHTDAKSSNWIVFNNQPVLIDAYGIRKLNSFLQLFGIRRLLRAMRDHPQYTPTDSLHLCLGFQPRGMPPTDDTEPAP